MEKINLTQSGRGYLIRIAASDACNFNCAFCRPEKKAPVDMLENEELLKIIRVICKKYVVKTIHFTGGEPLLRKDLDFVIAECRKIADPNVEIAMTTNGALLQGKIDKFVRAGLSRVNISLHTLDQARYEMITGTGLAVNKVKNVIEEACKSGLIVKTNSVIIRGCNDIDLKDIMDFSFSCGALPRFLELGLYGPVSNWFKSENVMMRDELIKRIEKIYGPITQDNTVRGNGPTKYYFTSDGKVLGIVDHQSNKLCIGCDRFRLSSNGKIRVCNFEAMDLKQFIASDEHLENAIDLLGNQLASRGMDYINKRIHKIDYNFRWNR